MDFLYNIFLNTNKMSKELVFKILFVLFSLAIVGVSIFLFILRKNAMDYNKPITEKIRELQDMGNYYDGRKDRLVEKGIDGTEMDQKIAEVNAQISQIEKSYKFRGPEGTTEILIGAIITAVVGGLLSLVSISMLISHLRS